MFKPSRSNINGGVRENLTEAGKCIQSLCRSMALQANIAGREQFNTAVIASFTDECVPLCFEPPMTCCFHTDHLFRSACCVFHSLSTQLNFANNEANYTPAPLPLTVTAAKTLSETAKFAKFCCYVNFLALPSPCPIQKDMNLFLCRRCIFSIFRGKPSEGFIYSLACGSNLPKVPHFIEMLPNSDENPLSVFIPTRGTKKRPRSY